MRKVDRRRRPVRQRRPKGGLAGLLWGGSLRPAGAHIPAPHGKGVAGSEREAEAGRERRRRRVKERAGWRVEQEREPSTPLRWPARLGVEPAGGRPLLARSPVLPIRSLRSRLRDIHKPAPGSARDEASAQGPPSPLLKKKTHARGLGPLRARNRGVTLPLPSRLSLPLLTCSIKSSSTDRGRARRPDPSASPAGE